MLKSALVIAGTGTRVLASMVRQPNRIEQRSWSSEFARRLASSILERGVNESNDWLRSKAELLALKGPVFLKVTWDKVNIDGVPCIRCRPKSGVVDKPPILYMHGGGYVIGSAESYRYTLAKLALATGAEVIGIDYRLVPEHDVSQAQLDCLAVAKSMAKDTGPKGADTEAGGSGASETRRVVLMGDSAGGGLVLSTVLRLKECGLEDYVAGCVLLSPWIQPFNPELLASEHEEFDILGHGILSHWASSLLVDDKRPDYVDFSETDFQNFPKLYVQASGMEVFLPQINTFVERLKQASVEVEYDVFEGQFHVFQTLAPLVLEADTAIAKIATALAEF